jgi:hypothetical protein
MPDVDNLSITRRSNWEGRLQVWIRLPSPSGPDRHRDIARGSHSTHARRAQLDHSHIRTGLRGGHQPVCAAFLPEWWARLQPVFSVSGPGTGNKTGWRRSGAVLFAFFGAASVCFKPDASRARLRFKTAIGSMTGGGAAICLGLTVRPSSCLRSGLARPPDNDLEQSFEVDNFPYTRSLGHGVHPSWVGDVEHHQHAMPPPVLSLSAEPSAYEQER